LGGLTNYYADPFGNVQYSSYNPFNYTSTSYSYSPGILGTLGGLGGLYGLNTLGGI
jgi:hypothetical protein